MHVLLYTAYYSLNLEHNSLSTFSGLVHLDNLKVSLFSLYITGACVYVCLCVCVCSCMQVLCLNHNRVEALFSSRDTLPSANQLMPSLQVLHLAYNGIRSLTALQLNRLPSLRALFLQGTHYPPSSTQLHTWHSLPQAMRSA